MIPKTQKKKNKKGFFIASFFVVVILATVSLYAIKSPYDKIVSFFTDFISGKNTKKIQEEK